MMKYRSKSQSGIILVDILLALSLGVVFVGIITESSLGSRDLFNRSHERDRALESFRADAYKGNTSLYGNDRIEMDVATSGISFLSVKAGVDALSAPGTPLCSVDFTHGQDIHRARIASIVLPIPQSIPLTDLEVRNGIAYVSANSSVVSDPDLYVFDIHDSNNARLLSSINTGPGISALALAGKRIFAAADSTASQLHVIRLDSLTSLVLENKYKLPPPYATATLPVATSIFYSSQKIYLGTSKWDGDEFNVIDVSNPPAASKIAGFETGTQLNNIYVSNGMAYVASSDQNQLRVIDLSDPYHLNLHQVFSPSGWQRQEGQVAIMFENAPSFGRTSGGFDIASDHELFTWATTSVANPSSPLSMNNPGGIYGIAMDRSHLFVGSRQTGKEFQIMGRTFSESSTTYALPASVESLTCDNDALYVLGHTASIIYQITF